MHFDLQNLKEILQVLDPMVVDNFFEDYNRSMSKDTRTYFRVCQRILSGKQGIPEKSIFRRGLTSKYSEMFAALDEVKAPLAKQQLTNKLYTFFGFYDKYYIADYERCLADIDELEYLGIDFLNIASSFDKAIDTSIMLQNGQKINSLRVYSDGVMQSPTLYRQTADDSQIVGCLFFLRDANYMLQSYPSTINNKGMANYLSIRTPNIDIGEIGLLPLDDCDFEFNDEVKETAEAIDQKEKKTLQLSLYEGRGPQSLYRG